MNARFPKLRLRAMPFRLVAAGVTAMIFFWPGRAAAPPTADPAADLQGAFAEAAHDAKISDDLDPAYELLGIADNAQQKNFPQIAAKAAAAFADLVKRATTKALK